MSAEIICTGEMTVYSNVSVLELEVKNKIKNNLQIRGSFYFTLGILIYNYY